ncbi:MAG: response regulator transcription factor [Gammaproteobacteria bacterium]
MHDNALPPPLHPLIWGGLNNQVIAQSLSIGKGTVKVHLHRIYGKLKARNGVELLLHARDKGWM